VLSAYFAKHYNTFDVTSIFLKPIPEIRSFNYKKIGKLPQKYSLMQGYSKE